MSGVHNWKSCPVYSGVSRETPEQGNKAMVIIQIGSTGCVLSYNPVILLSCQEGKTADERRLIAPLNRKGHEERKAQMLKSLYIEEIIRPGTRTTQIRRIYTDPGVSRQYTRSSMEDNFK